MSKLGNNLRQVEEVIIRPRLTEKATMLSGQVESTTRLGGPIYTFEISPTATKAQVEMAVKKMYKVKPLKIRVIKLPAKYKMRRGRLGRSVATRKAMVFLKAGDKIE